MKKKKSHKNPRKFFANERALRELSTFKHRDLQRACIVRGIPSPSVVDFDHHKLVEWFINNYDNAQDDKLLLDHDLWVEDQLKLKGYKNGDVLMSPALRYSYVGDIEKMEKPKVINGNKPLVIEGKKEKSVVDEITGIRSGTKKALTYQLTEQGIDIEEIIKEVIKQFPEAQDKSIKIWNKRKLKLM